MMKYYVVIKAIRDKKRNMIDVEVLAVCTTKQEAEKIRDNNWNWDGVAIKKVSQ